MAAVGLVFAGCAGNPDARIRRVYALGRSPSEPNKNRIEAMAADPSRDVRVAALVVMRTVDPARAIALARTKIEDPDGVVRGASARILGAAAADPGILQTLLAKAASDPDGQVRRQALEALAGVDDPAVAEAYARALGDPTRWVRRVALVAGASQPGFLPLDRVSALVVDDPDWENRVEAARVLGGSKDPAAFAPLDVAAGDANEFVRAAAVRGRRRLEKDGVVEPAPVGPAAAATKSGSGV